MTEAVGNQDRLNKCVEEEEEEEMMQYIVVNIRSAYLWGHDPNTVKSELNKAMAIARSKSDLG